MGRHASGRAYEELGIGSGKSTAGENRASRIGDRTMYIDIISARYVSGYRIELTFENGRSGVADFTKFISKGGIFSRLSDFDFFKSFRVNQELGVITWGDEIDLAPETLYSEATGEPLPQWMQEESEMRKTA
jgi:hypothetical protein